MEAERDGNGLKFEEQMGRVGRNYDMRRTRCARPIHPRKSRHLRDNKLHNRTPAEHPKFRASSPRTGHGLTPRVPTTLTFTQPRVQRGPHSRGELFSPGRRLGGKRLISSTMYYVGLGTLGALNGYEKKKTREASGQERVNGSTSGEGGRGNVISKMLQSDWPGFDN